MAKFKIEKSNTVNEYFDATNVIGGTGGLFNTLTPTVVSPNVYIAGGTKGAAGSIIRSKGRGKFQVADSTNLYPNAMTAGNAYAVITAGNTNFAKFTNQYTSYGTGDIFTVIAPSATDASSGTVNLVGVNTLTNVPGQNLVAGQASLPIYLNAFTANVGNLGASGALHLLVLSIQMLTFLVFQNQLLVVILLTLLLALLVMPQLQVLLHMAQMVQT